MDFFEHQERARRQSVRLVVLFVLAVAAIIVVVNLLVLMLLAQDSPDSPGPVHDLFGSAFFMAHLDIVLLVSLVTGGLIGLASLVRSQKLKAGGSVVARELGGTAVEADPSDPLRRRYRNVVEEVAIASGVPVPDIYVLEQEEGINAFAAGYSTSDAAVAVTRGALETLSREELKGVVAHEFAHILNGDMRLNIRLMGILFGILALALIGRLLMYSGSMSRNRNSGGIAMAGLAVMVVGYIGVFFGRWIKAAVSRQREYLADASAVQFTRNPGGIAGALKKIGVVQGGSMLSANAEEVGHMLFSQGFSARMMATHPPLEERIRAIEPGFDPKELQRIAQDMGRHQQQRSAEQESRAPSGGAAASGFTGTSGLAGRAGQPDEQALHDATVLSARLPETLCRAAHSEEWAGELLCALLIATEQATRQAQLGQVEQALGTASRDGVSRLADAVADLAPEDALALLEMAFPVIRHQSLIEVDRLVALTDRLVQTQQRVGVHSYALARLLRRQVEEVRNPHLSQSAGRQRLEHHEEAVRDLLRILAWHGQNDSRSALAAFSAGLAALGWKEGATLQSLRDDWHTRLDDALSHLDSLRPEGKRRLLEAMGAVASHSGDVVHSEMALLRVIAACLHIPLPPGTAR